MQASEQERQVIHPWVAEGLQKVRVGVSFLLYRNPVVLARIAADVDRLSGGRLVLGLGMGDLLLEFRQMGIPFLSTQERQEALEETIQIVRGLWGPAPFTFQGRHMQVEQCFLPVGPVQQPYAPLLIAGGGERVTLRQVAQYADAANFGPHHDTGSAFSVEDVVRKCGVLRAHCETVERPVDAVLRTHITIPLVMGETPAAIAAKQEAVPSYLRDPFRSSEMAVHPSAAIAYYKTLIEAGMQYFIMILWQNDLETLHMLAQQVIPALIRSRGR